MRRSPLINRARLAALATTLTFGASLIAGVSGAQAIVVDLNPGASGQTTVSYPNDQSSYYGVAMMPGTDGNLVTAGIPVVTSTAPCTDPALSSDFFLPDTGLCSHGGSVMHSNETFSLVWDPNSHRDYTAPYVDQFLRDVADGTGTFSSPYADTAQYTDASGRAENDSRYGGGYDFTAAYPANGCSVSGTHVYSLVGNGYTTVPNDVCLTDAQLQNELQSMVVQDGLAGRIQPGYTPLLVLQTPPGVVTCIGSGARLCSANSNPTSVPAQFCSYHSHVNVSGTEFDYVVLPFVADQSTSGGKTCDEPDAPPFPNPIAPDQLVSDMGARLVSPLSQGQIAAITNPSLNAWFALDGTEINDNTCQPIAQKLDQVTVGSSAQNPYLLQREFNNGGAIINDPFSYPCTPNVDLQANYVVPSAVNAGDVITFDGSKSGATLLVPRTSFYWDFGDGTTAIGPSAVHSYSAGGTYTVKLTIIDRGGDVDTLSQPISVLGPNGRRIPTPGRSTTLIAHLALQPQSLKNVLSGGISIRLTSNLAADGIATVSIPRSAAKRAHIKVGRSSSVRIGLGTVQIKNGMNTLHIKLSKATAAKLRRLGHVTLTVRLSLVASGNHRQAVVEAGRY